MSKVSLFAPFQKIIYHKQKLIAIQKLKKNKKLTVALKSHFFLQFIYNKPLKHSLTFAISFS